MLKGTKEYLYIGSSRDLYTRLKTHSRQYLNRSNRHPKFYAALAKYGLNLFKWGTIFLICDH